jgi:hypothetical protein
LYVLLKIKIKIIKKRSAETDFYQICRVIRELQSEKTLWLDALIRIREVEMNPLPLPTGDALDALSLSELQNVVRRVDRLMKNLKSEKPRPIRIDDFSIERWTRIFCIPGANLTHGCLYKIWECELLGHPYLAACGALGKPKRIGMVLSSATSGLYRNQG